MDEKNPAVLFSELEDSARISSDADVSVPPPQHDPFGPNRDQNVEPRTTKLPDLELATAETTPRISRNNFYLSIALSILWPLLFAPCLLFCTVPAIFLSHSAIEAAREGDFKQHKKKNRHSLCCNIVSIAVGGICWLILATYIVTTLLFFAGIAARFRI